MFDFNRKKILVTYLMYFGDLVTVTPFLEILRRYAPEADILSLIHISEPTRPCLSSRMPSSA